MFIYLGRGKKRKKPPVLSEGMDKAKRLVVNNGDENEPSTSLPLSTSDKRQRAPATYNFSKGPLMGQ